MARKPETAPFSKQPRNIQTALMKATDKHKVGCFAFWKDGKMHYVPKLNLVAALESLGYHLVSETIVLG